MLDNVSTIATSREAGPVRSSDDEGLSYTAPRRWRIAAWSLLFLTLVSGTLLRYQWSGGSPALFNGRFLLHAHSHVALLGWTFVGIFSLLFARRSTGSRGDPAPISPTPSRLAGEGLFLLLIAALFAAFLMQGYGFWSILLSMLHILVSFGFIAGYARGPRHRLDDAARPWLDLSMVWFVVATIGPMLLAGGDRFGQGWIDAWVGFYLTLLFNGWLTFAVIGLLVDNRVIRASHGVARIMALGVLPTAVPALAAWIEIPFSLWVGWVGALLFGGGLVAVVVGAGPAGTSWGPARWLRGSVLCALLLAAGLMALGAAPPLAPVVSEVRNLTIGFIHLQLVGFVSTALILLLFPAPRFATSAFLAGTWAMLAILFAFGLVELSGRPIFFPVQWALTGTGALMLVGASLLVGNGTATSPSAPGPTSPPRSLPS